MKDQKPTDAEFVIVSPRRREPLFNEPWNLVYFALAIFCMFVGRWVFGLLYPVIDGLLSH